MARLRGFPYKSHPFGWYQAAWSAELAPGAVKPAKYFDRDLVIYRTEAGQVVIMDAICRHQGAHLGHGGKVIGDDIVCPFHGWKWGCKGDNLDIPYSKQSPIKGTLQTYPVIERSGLVLMWYHPDGSAPDFEPPVVAEFEDPSYYPIYPHGVASEVLPFPPQLHAENGVDWPHLKFVHHWDADEYGLAEYEDRGRSFYVRAFGAIDTPRGVAKMQTEINYWGVGLIYSHLTGLRDMGFISSMIPIDESTSELRLTTAVRRKEGDEGDVPDKFALAMIGGQITEVLGTHQGGDRDIWEHMVYQPNPALTREEVGGMIAIRKWMDKFYEDPIYIKPKPTAEIAA